MQERIKLPLDTDKYEVLYWTCSLGCPIRDNGNLTGCPCCGAGMIQVVGLKEEKQDDQ